MAMRIAEWKGKGYIFIPVVVEEDADPENFIKSSDFNTVWQVLQTIVDQDHRLEDTVSNLRVMQGKGEEGTQAWKDAMAEYAEKIEFYNLPSKVDKTKFINTLHTKTVEVVGKSWDFWYGLTVTYKKQFGDPNVLAIYKTPEGYSLGSWQDRQRQYYRKRSLSLDRIKKLEEIGFKWNVLEDTFERGFQETVKYKNQFGNPKAPYSYKTAEGYSLGTWQAHQRALFRKGLLLPDNAKKLGKIGFKWKLRDDAFEHGFTETLKYKEQFGDPNAPNNYKTLQGHPLGKWQSHQRSFYKKDKLTPNRTKRLEGIGFKWELRNKTESKIL